MELNSTKERIKKDPAAYSLICMLEQCSEELNLEEAIIYYDFPLYKDEENVVSSKIIILSPHHGAIVLWTCNASEHNIETLLYDSQEELDHISGFLYSKIIKNKRLRTTQRKLLFNYISAIYAPAIIKTPDIELEFDLVVNDAQITALINDAAQDRMSDSVFLELVAAVEGSKGLIRTTPRDLCSFPPSSKLAHLATLEAEIANFDRDQKHGYMSILDGPQRIRGLAGSGKTVVLAMKAAITHLRDKNAKILFTFYTKSMYQHIRRLITRFYRQFDDVDPNWDNLHIYHAWGGKSTPGVYYTACLINNIAPLTYPEAKRGNNSNPFDYACTSLLSLKKIQPIYDYVFIDEGQDFPPSFLQLSLALAKNNRMVWAYDELQTIFQVEAPSPEQIFGKDETGKSLVDLDEDIVLHKCYRNPLEIIVCAHSLGFGIYSKIVQLLENKEHWEDVGYEVVEGDFIDNSMIKILRPSHNSPNSISANYNINEILQEYQANSIDDEAIWVTNSIVTDIKKEGLQPSDILIMCADDWNSKDYFRLITQKLREHDIEVNNLQLDTYGIQNFSVDGCVTLTSVHRAKGNEAYSVYLMGVDALFLVPNVRSRNMIFAAMTRAKAWLHISGMGKNAAAFFAELKKAKAKCPYLEFRYLDEEERKVMRRDLREDLAQKATRLLDELQDELPYDLFQKLMEERMSEGKKPRKKPIKRAKKHEPL